MMRAWWSVSLLVAACGSAAQQVPVERAQAPIPVAAPAVTQVQAPATPRSSGEEHVAVRGIEGSMSSYDVRATMERRSSELAACHEPRARAVPALSGQAEFAIAVSADGRVSDVDVRSSDLGDMALERCVVDVITQTPFPRPNGGDARVTWTMMLAPLRETFTPEPWEREHIARVLDKRLPDLHKECEVGGGGQYDVTAYVNKRGRIVSAGVRTRRPASPEDLDCIVAELRSWSLPKPKTSRFAKVTFDLAQARTTVARVAKVARRR